MYDPVSGIGYAANTYEEHILYQQLGYTHTAPATTSTVNTGQAFGAATVTDTGTATTTGSGTTAATSTTTYQTSGSSY